MKYLVTSLEDRIDLIIREEVNKDLQEDYSDFLNQFIDNLTYRLTNLIIEEINYRKSR